jgi:predicted transcriptional regulator
MDVIYAAGKATAAEVVEALPGNLSNSTVRTLLRILVEKGHLRQKFDGPRYVYRPIRSRPNAAQGELKRVVETFFDGSVEQAVAGLLQSPDLELNGDELDRLGQMIEKARKEGR